LGILPKFPFSGLVIFEQVLVISEHAHYMLTDSDTAPELNQHPGKAFPPASTFQVITSMAVRKIVL